MIDLVTASTTVVQAILVGGVGAIGISVACSGKARAESDRRNARIGELMAQGQWDPQDTRLVDAEMGFFYEEIDPEEDELNRHFAESRRIVSEDSKEFTRRAAVLLSHSRLGAA